MSSWLVCLLLGGNAWAVSLDVDEHPGALDSGPEQGTVVLDRAASKREPAMGVLYIPVDEQVPVEAARDEEGSSHSLGFARVPLPAAAWLFGTAVVGIIAVSRRRPGGQLG